MIEDSNTTGAIIFFPDMCNIYGCEIGAGTTIGPFVEVQRGARIGRDSKVCSHAFICGGTVIGDRVFIGHGVMFCNDVYPIIGKATHLLSVVVEDDVSIGSGAVICPGVRIGQGAIIGAGTVVAGNVSAYTTVVGNPGRAIRYFNGSEQLDQFLKERHDTYF